MNGTLNRYIFYTKVKHTISKYAVASVKSTLRYLKNNMLVFIFYIYMPIDDETHGFGSIIIATPICLDRIAIKQTERHTLFDLRLLEAQRFCLEVKPLTWTQTVVAQALASCLPAVLSFATFSIRLSSFS